MSYAFSRASSQYLEIASALVSARPHTFSAHVYVSEASPSANMSIVAIGGSASANSFLKMYILATTRELYWWERAGIGGTTNLPSGLIVPNGQWSYIAVSRVQSVSLGSSYVDIEFNVNGSAATATGAHRAPTVDRTAIGCSPAGSRVDYFEGSISEAAIWNTNLSSGELQSLARGFSPIAIRADNLVGYWPLLQRLDSPIECTAMSAYNTPVIADHSPVRHAGALYNFGLGSTSGVGTAVKQMIHYKRLRQ